MLMPELDGVANAILVLTAERAATNLYRIETWIKYREFSPWRFSVAPMMDWTDRHCRFFHRLLTRRARLYTEMVTADAVVFGPRERLIGFDAFEHPLALQLGGADPARLAAGRARSAPTSAMTKSISIAAVPRIACRTAGSAPA